MGGIGHGILSLVGMGKLYDPMGDLRGQMAQSNAKLNAMVQAKSLEAIQGLSDDVKELYTLLGTNETKLQTFIDQNNQLLWEQIKEENLFISILAVSVIIIIFFMLVAKNS